MTTMTTTDATVQSLGRHIANKCNHRIEDTIKEGTADSIRMDEVATALKKIKRNKAPGMSGLVAEMIQSTWDIGTQWILDFM